MANPQLENGYTRIANEIFEHIAKVELSGGERRVIDVVWRMTYGFKGRKMHPLSISYIMEATNLSKRTTQKYIDRLLERKILIGAQKGTIRLLGFNKNHTEWELGKVPEKIKDDAAPKKKQKNKRVYEEDNQFYKMAVYFHQLITQVAKEAEVEYLIANVNLQTWANDFRLLWEKDKVQDKHQIMAIMEWVTQNEFWRTNVLSAGKFRKQYFELAVKMAADKKPKKQNKFKHPSHFEADPRDQELAFNKWVAAGGDPDEFVYNG